MKVISENSVNWLIQTDDGRTETKTKASDLNQLLYNHGLWGVLDTGNEIWTSEGSEAEPSIRLIPGEDAESYTIDPDGRPKLQLAPHYKTDIVSAMQTIYQDHDNETVAPLLNLYERVRGNMVRADLLDAFLPALGDRVEKRESGWFINGHLLLTYEGEFYHSEHVSRNRNGGIIGEGTSSEAYSQAVPEPDGSINREITVDGEDRVLTMGEVEYLTKAMWGIENTPDRRES